MNLIDIPEQNSQAKDSFRSNSGDSGSKVKFHDKFILKIGTGLPAKRLKIQANWYQNIPNNIKDMFPEIYMVEWEENKASVVMEKIYMKSFCDHILNSNVEDNKNWDILEKILNEIKEKMYCDSISSDCNSTMSLFYQTKERYDVFRKNSMYKEITNKKYININGEYLKIGTDLFNEIEKHLKKMLNTQKERDTIHFIHGDLHTDNILVNDIDFKLIDPRGNFANNDIYFDISYDIGKMLHDLHGKYNLIRLNKFNLRRKENSFYISLEKGDDFLKYDDLLLKYKKWCEDNIYDKRNLDDSWGKAFLYEGLLLLGIIPFHINNPERALMFFLSSIIFLNRWLKWRENELEIIDLFESV